jgi:hypothetical protein
VVEHPAQRIREGTYYYGLTLIDGDVYRVFMWTPSGTPLAAFMEFVAKRGVAPLRYSFEDDLEDERQSTERLGA